MTIGFRASLKIPFLLRLATKMNDFTQNVKNLLTLLQVRLRDFLRFVFVLHFFAQSRHESNF
jgi:hypothetical protein